MKHIYIKIAGVINLFTAIIHVTAGQTDLVKPLLDSGLETQQIGEWVGVWHMITVLLFFTSYVIIRAGFGSLDTHKIEQLRIISMLYMLIGIPFIGVSLWFNILAPQWILLMPIGFLLHIGLRKLGRE